jgi:hypothetical protein
VTLIVLQEVPVPFLAGFKRTQYRGEDIIDDRPETLGADEEVFCGLKLLPQISADKRRSEIISRESTRKTRIWIWFV